MKHWGCLSALVVCWLHFVPICIAQDRLRPIIVAEEGQILDFDGTRALAVSASGLQASILSATSPPVVIYNGTKPITSGQISAGRALLNERWFWNGELEELPGPAKLAGSWLAYLRTEPPFELEDTGNFLDQSSINLRDLDFGQEIWAWRTNPGVDSTILSFDVAADGDVVWELFRGEPEIWGKRDQTIVRIGTEARVGTCTTDGINALTSYQTFITPYTLHTPSGEEEICVDIATGTAACGGVELAGGWVAYAQGTRTMGSMGDVVTLDVFRRNPSGTREQLTNFGVSTSLMALSPGGEVMVRNTRDYLLRDGQAPLEIGPPVGKPIYRDAWFVIAGATVFEVDVSGQQAAIAMTETTVASCEPNESASPAQGPNNDGASHVDAQ